MNHSSPIPTFKIYSLKFIWTYRYQHFLWSNVVQISIVRGHTAVSVGVRVPTFRYSVFSHHLSKRPWKWFQYATSKRRDPNTGWPRITSQTNQHLIRKDAKIFNNSIWLFTKSFLSKILRTWHISPILGSWSANCRFQGFIQQGNRSSHKIDAVFFYVHVTVHRNKFLYNKTNQMHQYPKFIPAWKSTCFGQFLCPSSGVYSLYTRHWYMSHRFEESFRAGPG